MRTLKQAKLIQVFTLLFVFAAFTRSAIAKSVYAITDRESTVTAYHVAGHRIEYPTAAENLPNNGIGAVGLALDPDSATLFVTYESSNIIEMVNAKTMISEENPVTVPGTIANGLSGIAFDQSKQKLYVLKRQDNRLYVYLWNPVTRNLTLEGDTYKTLENIGTYPNGAYGIALDESNDRLFVTNATKTVHYYDSNDPNWAHKGSINIVVDSNPREAIGIAIDSTNRYMYTGAFTGIEELHTCLVRTDINDVNNPSFTEKNTDTGVIGLTLDEAMGLLYITTSNDHIEVYNAVTWPSDPCHIETEGIGGPADIVLAGNVGYKPRVLALDKEHDVNDCVLPGEYITYTITYDGNGHNDTNAVITDFLPPEVDFNSASDDGNYNPIDRTVTWHIDYVDANESNSVTLSVKVNDLADLNRAITNTCEMECDIYFSLRAEIDANVCCWPLDIIYVDANAAGDNTGASWQNAYTDLQSALNRAGVCGANEIWVAEGTYKPTTDPQDDEATFELIDGVPLYGGFAGSETSRCRRNWWINETILTGDIDGAVDVRYVVSTSEANEATIDGFIITMGSDAGINCSSASLASVHNRITENASGIKCDDSNVTVSNCLIADNSYGVYCLDSSLLTVRTSQIQHNSGNGIYCSSISTAVIENNWIHHNIGGCGIQFVSADSTPLVRNNTIVYNYIGIWATQCQPYISNCIIWGNGESSADNLWGTFAGVEYSCIEGGYSGTGNINDDPRFVDDPNDPNNYHLAPDSPCIDTGDPTYELDDPNETDIDGEKRLIDGDANGTVIVDMGADEYYWSLADFNCDEIVNSIDYAMFADNWLKADDIHDYDDLYDLEDNNAIDYNDLAPFCDDWLWQAGWTRPFTYGLGMGCGAEGMGMESQQMMGSSYPPEAEPIDIDEILEWLEEIWLEFEELREMITEDEWKDFLKAVKKSAK